MLHGNSASSLMPLTLVRKLDMALLEPSLNREEVETGCLHAIRFDCHSVVVKPHYIEFARKQIKESGLKLASVIGFPHGGVTTATKMYETQDIIQRGAEEISTVLNLGALRDHEDLLVRNDVATIVRTARGRPVTVIIESQLIDEEEVLRACRIADEAGATQIQIGSGFASIHAYLKAVLLVIGSSRLPVLAGGRVDSLEQAEELLQAGATRVVASQLER